MSCAVHAVRSLGKSGSLMFSCIYPYMLMYMYNISFYSEQIALNTCAEGPNGIKVSHYMESLHYPDTYARKREANCNGCRVFFLT